MDIDPNQIGPLLSGYGPIGLLLFFGYLYLTGKLKPPGPTPPAPAPGPTPQPAPPPDGGTGRPLVDLLAALLAGLLDRRGIPRLPVGDGPGFGDVVPLSPAAGADPRAETVAYLDGLRVAADRWEAARLYFAR